LNEGRLKEGRLKEGRLKEERLKYEIERKFLVKIDKWGVLVRPEGHLYVQGYLNTDPEKTIRVRIADSKGYITLKGIMVGAKRLEYEYEIPAGEAKEILDNFTENHVAKIRYKFNFKGDPNAYEETYTDDEGDDHYTIGDEEYSEDDEGVDNPYGQVYRSAMVQDLLKDMYAWERRLGELNSKKKQNNGYLEDKEYMEYTQIYSHLDNVTNYLKEHFEQAIGNWIKGHADKYSWSRRFLGFKDGGYNDDFVYENLRENNYVFNFGVGREGSVDLKPCLIKKCLENDHPLFAEISREFSPYIGRVSDDDEKETQIEELTNIIEDGVDWNTALRASDFSEERVEARIQLAQKEGEDISREQALATLIAEENSPENFVEELTDLEGDSIDGLISRIEDFGNKETWNDIMDRLRIEEDDLIKCLGDLGYDKWYNNLTNSRVSGKTLDQVVQETQQSLDQLKGANTLGDKLVWIDNVVNMQHYGGRFTDYLGIDRDWIDKLKGRTYITLPDNTRVQATLDGKTNEGDLWLFDIKGKKYHINERYIDGNGKVYDRKYMIPVDEKKPEVVDDKKTTNNSSSNLQPDNINNTSNNKPDWFKPNFVDNGIKYMLSLDGQPIGFGAPGYMELSYQPQLISLYGANYT